MFRKASMIKLKLSTNLLSDAFTTKQIEVIVSIYFVNNYVILSVLILSYYNPLVSPNPGVSIILRAGFPLNGLT
jgi:hypothetical protein